MRLSFFSRSIPSSGTPYRATGDDIEAVPRPRPVSELRGPDEFPGILALNLRRAERRISELEVDLDAVRAERDAAVNARDEMTEGVRQALISAGYFHSVDPVLGVRRMAAEFVETAAQLRAANQRVEGLQREAAGLRLIAGAAEQDRRNAIEATKRLEQVRHEKEDLEKLLAQKEHRAAPINIIDREGSPWAPC